MRTAWNDRALKAASLGLATLLWFAIAAEKTSEMGLSVPVELQNFPKDLELTGDTVDAVEVRLRASPGVIQQLGKNEISALIDLQGAGEGERIVHLTAESIRVPFGVTVVKITPAIITLNLERTLQKVVAVHPRLLGRPANGYEVAQLVSTPPEVRIAGPRSRVDEVESAFTEPISVEAARSTVEASVNIGIEDPLLRIQGSPRVQVAARIREVHRKKVFESLTVEVRGGTATVRPLTVRVTLTGPESVLGRLPAEDVRPYVEITKLSGKGRVPVAVELGPGHAGVNVEGTDPPEVTVRAVNAAPRE